MRRGGGRPLALAAAPLLLILPGCSSPITPAGLTADDQDQLNEAAVMLDANSMDPRTIVTNESTTP